MGQKGSSYRKQSDTKQSLRDMGGQDFVYAERVFRRWTRLYWKRYWRVVTILFFAVMISFILGASGAIFVLQLQGKIGG